MSGPHFLDVLINMHSQGPITVALFKCNLFECGPPSLHYYLWPREKLPDMSPSLTFFVEITQAKKSSPSPSSTY